MPPSHKRALRDIINCRTEALGGQVYFCEQCQDQRYSYHSCQNRHCPKCGNDQATVWLTRQNALLLQVKYFMVTFALPEELRELARRQQKIFYGLFFQASAAALQKLGRDPKFVGGELGFFGVLQTWTRDLRYHPHVHYIVAGGGLSADGAQWLSARENFLVPVKALSKIFRAKLRDALQKADLFKLVPPTVWQKDWVVHAEPVGTGEAALKYLAPYIFRVAISNKRLVKMEEGRVTFQYKESEHGQWQIQTLPAEEFIRRFLQHVLPKGFIKVRYYGFLSPRRRECLEKIKTLLHVPPTPTTPEAEAKEEARDPQEAPLLRCPKCGNVMRLLGDLPRKARLPP
jgi:hypothetical protein